MKQTLLKDARYDDTIDTNVCQTPCPGGKYGAAQKLCCEGSARPHVGNVDRDLPARVVAESACGWMASPDEDQHQNALRQAHASSLRPPQWLPNVFFRFFFIVSIFQLFNFFFLFSSFCFFIFSFFHFLDFFFFLHFFIFQFFIFSSFSFFLHVFFTFFIFPFFIFLKKNS